MLPEISVNFDDPLGEGNERRLVHHPERPERAIKVYNERRPEMTAPGLRGWAARNLTSVRNRRQRRELECFLDLHLSGATADPELPIARIIGFCQTTHGPGLVVEKIRRRADDPAVARNLRWLLEDPVQAPLMPDALNDLMDRLARFNIFVSDANYENIMMSHAGQRTELVMVDGFGDYRTIRWFSHAPWMVRRSIRRAFRAQAAFWNLTWDQRHGRFATNLT